MPAIACRKPRAITLPVVALFCVEAPIFSVRSSHFSYPLSTQRPDLRMLDHSANGPLGDGPSPVRRTGISAPSQMYPNTGGNTITTIAAHAA
jgi:hypothetical protein